MFISEQEYITLYSRRQESKALHKSWLDASIEILDACLLASGGDVDSAASFLDNKLDVRARGMLA